MFVRVVRLKLVPDGFWPFRQYYESRILPALEKTAGCLLAVLLRRADGPDPETCVSLTLWEAESHADAYVDSGLYDRLLDGADPFLASATEWRQDLSQLAPSKRPMLPDPEVLTYSVRAAREARPQDVVPLYLRIVDMRIEPSRFEDLRRVYEDVVAPGLLSTPGCRAAYLVEGPERRAHALSVTLWDDQASAVRYETGGRFDELVACIGPFLLGLYQWRLSLVPDGDLRGVKGSDLEVRGFHAVVGRRLGADRR